MIFLDNETKGGGKKKVGVKHQRKEIQQKTERLKGVQKKGNWDTRSMPKKFKQPT